MQARLALRVRHCRREMIEAEGRLLGRSSKLVPTAPAVMMRRALFAVGRALVAITLVVTGCLGRRGHANFSLRGMRQAARPHHQDEHQRANEGFPGSHPPGPVAARLGD